MQITIGDEKILSVLLGCYGDYPQYTARAVQSILTEKQQGFPFDLHVGCNAVAPRVLNFIRHCYDQGRLDSLIESRENINKDPLMRLLIEVTTTPYFLWLDDDSYLKTGAIEGLYKFIYQHHLFDGAGFICFIHSFPAYEKAARQRPWWKGRAARPPQWGRAIYFPVGGAFLARTDFLRDHDFPDFGMLKRWDDTLFGDLLGQYGDRMKPFDETVAPLIVANAGERRGGGEDEGSWRALPHYRGYKKSLKKRWLPIKDNVSQTKDS